MCWDGPQWISATLRTLTSNHKHLRQISLDVANQLFDLRPDCANVIGLRGWIGETTYQEWLEVDSLLAHLWESHPILKVSFSGLFTVDKKSARCCAESLLPDAAARGIVELV